MAAPNIIPEANGPLSPSQQGQVAAAQDRSQKIRRAANVAGFNGWVTGILAVCSIPFALFSLPGLLVTVGLFVVAYNEFQGRRRLLKFDREAPKFLGWNQLGFLAMIILYCAWMLFTGLTSEGPLTAELKANPELNAALESIGEFDWVYRLLVVGIYGTTIVLSIVFQGMNACFYFTRRKHVLAYLQNTPDWVLDLQRLTSPT